MESRACSSVAAVLLAWVTACGDPDPTCDAQVCGPVADAGRMELPTVSEEQACRHQATVAEGSLDNRVDIVFVVDNSSSMGDEIEAIRANINRNFASIITQTGVDFRVVLITQYGVGATDLCIDPPLAGAPCGRGIAAAQSPVFMHYDQEIDSISSFCRILETLRRPDSAGLAPAGWSDFLRPDAHKALVVITDDSAACTYEGDDGAVTFGEYEADPYEDALAFHGALLKAAPEQFGVPPDVKYRFYSIVGVAPAGAGTDPWFPHQPIPEQRCDSAASRGASYQALSIVTDALRYPVCEGRGFDAVFQVLAADVIQAARADCTFEVPEAPPRQAIDLASVTVEYTSSTGGEVQRIAQVEDENRCAGDTFYVEQGRIELCAEACRKLRADVGAAVQVLYGCTLIPD